MKIISILILTFSLLGANAQTIYEVRESFHSVVLYPEKSKTFHDLLSLSSGVSPTIDAYQAVSEAMLAQVLWNPISKLSQVAKYNRMMEDVVKRDPGNIEIRFLRLAVEYNLPRFLGMSEHIDEDRSFILSNLSEVSALQLDPKFGNYIIDFMLDAKLISGQEVEQVQSRLLTLNQ